MQLEVRAVTTQPTYLLGRPAGRRGQPTRRVWWRTRCCARLGRITNAA